MLWSQIIYGHRTASISPKIVRFYGARPAAGRIVRFLIILLDIVRCPVKFRYYLKFHGAHTAFGRVIEGKMTSAGHRTVSWQHSAGVCTHRTGTVRFLSFEILYRTMSYNRQEYRKSLNKSADARPGTSWCFMSRTATGEKRHVFAEEHIV